MATLSWKHTTRRLTLLKSAQFIHSFSNGPRCLFWKNNFPIRNIIISQHWKETIRPLRKTKWTTLSICLHSFSYTSSSFPCWLHIPWIHYIQCTPLSLHVYIVFHLITKPMCRSARDEQACECGWERWRRPGLELNGKTFLGQANYKSIQVCMNYSF